MKKIVVAFMVMITMTGCGNKNTKIVCKSGVMDNKESIFVLGATGDKVTKTVETQRMDFSDPTKYAVLSESDVEDLAKALETGYKTIKGVTFTYTVKDKTLEYSITLDNEEVDFDVLQDKSIVRKEDGETYVSLKASVEKYEKEKMTCN